MKFSPTVAEMADMSPMCSIMEAMAMGAITKMAEMSNLATLPVKLVTNGWNPRIGASAMPEKSSMGPVAPVAASVITVAPQALAITATR